MPRLCAWERERERETKIALSFLCSDLRITRHDKGKLERMLECHTTTMYWGVEVKIYVYLRMSLDGNEWSASYSGRFSPWEIIHDIGIGEWEGLRAALNVVTKSYKATNLYWHCSLYMYSVIICTVLTNHLMMAYLAQTCSGIIKTFVCVTVTPSFLFVRTINRMQHYKNIHLTLSQYLLRSKNNRSCFSCLRQYRSDGTSADPCTGSVHKYFLSHTKSCRHSDETEPWQHLSCAIQLLTSMLLVHSQPTVLPSRCIYSAQVHVYLIEHNDEFTSQQIVVIAYGR
jgi:hypothetical protein